MVKKRKHTENNILKKSLTFSFGTGDLLLEVVPVSLSNTRVGSTEEARTSLGNGMALKTGEERVGVYAQVKERHAFARNLLQYALEYELEEPDDGIFSVNMTAPAADTEKKENHAEDSYLQVQVAERILRGKDLTNAEQDFREEILRALERTIVTLGNADWNAACIRACRLWQAGMHKPQDRVEMFLPEQATALGFAENDLLTVCSKETKAEKVRLGLPGDKSLRNMDDDAVAHKEEYVFLTNRLIEIMFGREWIMGREEEAGLRGIPFLLYKNLPDIYSLGIPKADQIDGVSFSSGLYEEKKEEAKLYDYVVYNRYTDSRLFVDYGKADYKDYGRVKDAAGQPASKIMIPRYQRKLLGYLDQPLKMIRAEEFPGLLAQAEEEDAKILEACYERISGETYYSLKEDTDVPAEQAYQILKKLHVYDRAELLKIPKKQKEKRGLFGILRNLLNKGSFFLLDKTIGKAEYLLKCEWTSETDDRNNVARLSSNMMSLIGVAENDKIRIKFGNRVQILRVLKNDDLGDYQIGIPATARKKLGMNSVNDIVVVHRDMVHIFLRHSEEQTIAILGTVLAVFQVTKTIWLGILACLIFIPLIMYFVLNEERVKVK